MGDRFAPLSTATFSCATCGGKKEMMALDAFLLWGLRTPLGDVKAQLTAGCNKRHSDGSRACNIHVSSTDVLRR